MINRQCLFFLGHDTRRHRERQVLNGATSESSVISLKMKYLHITPRRIRFHFTGAYFVSIVNSLGQLPVNLFRAVTFTLSYQPSKSSGVS